MNRGQNLVNLALKKGTNHEKDEQTKPQLEPQPFTSFQPDTVSQEPQPSTSFQPDTRSQKPQPTASLLVDKSGNHFSSDDSLDSFTGTIQHSESAPQQGKSSVEDNPEHDFSSDDSVLDPMYQPPVSDQIASSSDVESDSQQKVSARASLRLIKREKKLLRNLGKSYKTLKGKSIPERKMLELGTCRMKCKERFPCNVRQAIFSEYWSLGSHSKRTAYMASLMEIVDKATIRIRTSDPDKQKFRTKTYKYSVLVNGKRESICRTCLLKILNESDNFIKTVALKKRSSTAGTQTDDMRGKNFIPKNKISDSVRETIKQHILSFPSYESHYTRKSTSKRYLPSHLTIQEMYNLYCDNRENPPSIKIYRQEFHKLNLAFKKPRVDTCVTCDKFKMTIQCAQDEHGKTTAINAHDRHKMLADQAYTEKALDTSLCKENDSLAVFTFDLQQCLLTPSLTSSVVFYKRQLWTYNLTVHNNKTGQAVCYIWYETVAARGANQIASCLLKHLKLYLRNNVKHVIFYSDTCAGQNRNSYVSSMFTWAIQNTHIEKIDHKFMIPGHSHLEVDTDHGIIEKKKKKTSLQIYHPHDWIQLIKSSSSKFDVCEMKPEDFFEFSSLLKGPLVLRNKDCEGQQLKWLEKRWLRYEKDFGVVLFKDVLEREVSFKVLNLKRRNCQIPATIPVCSMIPLPISDEKKQDLISLFSLIPEVFHNFYENLPTQANVPNTDPDLDLDNDEVEF